MREIDTTLPEAPELERAYRDAIEALRPLVRAGQPIEVPLEELGTNELRAELEGTYANAEMIWARELGAHMSWEASRPAKHEYWDLRTYVMDFDSGTHRDSDPLFRTDELRQGFRRSALSVAATAYKRECKWDFVPDQTGVWLLALRPTTWAIVPDEEMSPAGGDLVGFLILHDRDHDTAYESIAHIWTAVRWRCRGIAARLIDLARTRFPIVAVEGQTTQLGRSLLQARAADLPVR